MQQFWYSPQWEPQASHECLKEMHIAQPIQLIRQSVPPDDVTQTMNRKLQFLGDIFEQMAIANGSFQPISYVFPFVLSALMPS